MVGPKFIVWQLTPVSPVIVMMLQFAAGLTKDQPVGRSMLNRFAGAPVTAVAVIVIGVVFVPVVPMIPVDVAVGDNDAADADTAPSERRAAVRAVATML